MEQVIDPTLSGKAKIGNIFTDSNSHEMWIYTVKYVIYKHFGIKDTKNKTVMQHNGYEYTYVEWYWCKSQAFDAKEHFMYVTSSVLIGLSDRTKNRLQN